MILCFTIHMHIMYICSNAVVQYVHKCTGNVLVINVHCNAFLSNKRVSHVLSEVSDARIFFTKHLPLSQSQVSWKGVEKQVKTPRCSLHHGGVDSPQCRLHRGVNCQNR